MVATAEDVLNSKRRLYDRLPSRFPTKFKHTRTDFGMNVHLRNVSAQGVKIATMEQLYVNDSISLEVELNDGKTPLTLRGEVVWSTKHNEELWDVGIKFHKIVLMDLWRICKAAENSSL